MSQHSGVTRWLLPGLSALLIGAALSVAVPDAAVAAKKPPQEWDGLQRRENKRLDNVYVRPNVQFTAYKSVRLDPVEVQFDKDWDPNRSAVTLSQRLSKDDIQRIRADLSKVFREEFAERLSKGGYPLVDEDGDDVLRVQAALINVYINAPDTSMQTAGRSRTYVMDAGRMTVVMQLQDSVTGQVLARVVDTKQGSSTGRLQWSTSVSNSAEARRAFGDWADALRRGLDVVNGKTPSK